MNSRCPVVLSILGLIAGACSNDTSKNTNTERNDVVCAASTPAAFDLSTAGRAEGLVVGPDGTVYFSDFGTHVKRYAPPYTSGVETAWATVDNAWIFGVMLDPKRKVVYAGSRSPKGMTTPAPAVYKIDITDPSKVSKFADAESGINGLTMGDDGSLYYSDQIGGHIYRVSAEGTKSQVTKSPIDNADGIAFGPDGKLYVIPYLATGCPITRLTLDASHVEAARDVYVDLTGQGGKNGDGIAFDRDGNVYLTAAGLFKVTPEKTITKLSMQGGANIEFGAGALACTELLWATNNATVPPQKLSNDVVGQDVYWHRP